MKIMKRRNIIKIITSMFAGALGNSQNITIGTTVKPKFILDLAYIDGIDVKFNNETVHISPKEIWDSLHEFDNRLTPGTLK